MLGGSSLGPVPNDLKQESDREQNEPNSSVSCLADSILDGRLIEILFGSISGPAADPELNRVSFGDDSAPRQERSPNEVKSQSDDVCPAHEDGHGPGSGLFGRPGGRQADNYDRDAKQGMKEYRPETKNNQNKSTKFFHVVSIRLTPR